MEFFAIISIISIATLVLLLYCELKRDLMFFQQNSYRPERYMRWLRQSGDSTSYKRLIAIFILLFSLAAFRAHGFAAICTTFFAIVVSVGLIKKKYKKPLAITKRIKRMFIVLILEVLVFTAAALCASFFGLFGAVQPLYTVVIVLLLFYCLSHFLVFAAYYILQPVEKNINRKFYRAAQEKLASMPDLKIIGITGSYGKTSTKHYLYRILSESFETLMTPGSYNTTLGVVRTVNEQLKSYHQVFIAEMGAKQTGDIKEICDLVHPSMGILTSVGPQHLETFKSIENVVATKFELIDSLPSDGIAILNNDYELIANRVVDNCKAIRYSCGESGCDYEVVDIEYNVSGTRFKLKCPDGNIITLETQLLGRHNIANLVGAVIVALNLGMSQDKIRYSVSHIEAVEHRLSIRRIANGLTILDDAFNSNPIGASMAVEVLSGMNTGRRIIITPGMIELGEEQYQQNYEFGRKIAAGKIDYVAVVGQYNKNAITEGLLAEGQKESTVLHFDSFLEANAWMVAFAKPGDVVLIENDLPDTFK